MAGSGFRRADGAARTAQQFVDVARRVVRMGELTGVLSEATAELGFSGVTLMHHVDPMAASARTIAYSDYPMAYLALSFARRYFAEDPVLVAAERRAAPFLWSELPTLVALSDRHREILEAAAATGLDQGLTVPVNVPGEPRGSCSFAARRGRKLREEACQAALWAGVFAFDQARRILGLARSPEAQRGLSPRQLDCVVLVGQGKSDWTIAQLLGLSKETVHEHVEAAKARYRVATRQQLVAACLADGLVTYADLQL
jgi:LuxR family quorum-sensing system transcriptional regulator CciR